MCSFEVCLSVGVCAGTGHQASLIRALNANSSKTVKTDFKFDTHVSRDSPDMTPEKFVEKGAWPWSLDPHIFGG